MKISNKIEICNLALARIEQSSISSFEDEDSMQAQYCRMSYEQSKSALLSQYTWSFAINSATLTQVEYNDAIKEFDYKYSLPESFLAFVALYNSFNQEVLGSGYKPIYNLMGGFLYTDVDNAKLKYVKDIDTVSSFSPLFIDCFVLDLAIRLTRLFQSSGTYLQQLEQELNIALRAAKSNDCRQVSLGGLRAYPLLASTGEF